MMYIAGSKERCMILGAYIIENKSTVRATASHFGISKSTVHKDVTKVLKGTNKALYRKVADLLDKNKLERHIRGGEATKKKYADEKEARASSERMT